MVRVIFSIYDKDVFVQFHTFVLINFAAMLFHMHEMYIQKFCQITRSVFRQECCKDIINVPSRSEGEANTSALL